MSDINDRYNQLTQNKSRIFNIRINAYIPTPDDADYKRGYITRYFVQKANDKASPIFEVSDREYGRITTNQLYFGTSLRWRLSGPREPQYNQLNGKLVDMGVVESNKKSIEISSDGMPNLKLYLPNLMQFNR